jgi:hypothetical protein
MLRRIAIATVAGVLWLGGSGLNTAQALTIQNILDSGGSITVGPFTYTFTANSVTGASQNGPYTAADISVDTAGGGITFTPSPMLDLKTQQGGQSLQLGISYTVTSTVPILSAALAFTPGLVENQGTSEATKTFTGRAETLHVFKTNDNGTISQQLTDSTNFADMPMTLSVNDVGKVSLAVAQGNQRTIQLIDMTNTFTALAPEPSSLALLGTLVPLGLLVCRRKRK